MIELIFKCNKCKKIEVIKNPCSDQEQPYCLPCGMPMFIKKAKVGESE